MKHLASIKLNLKRLSLRLRLTLLFVLLASAAWVFASAAAWKQTSDELDTLFDSQQLLFAKRLSLIGLDEFTNSSAHHGFSQTLRHKNLDDKALAFAIYSRDGKLLLQDGVNGQNIPYDTRRDGFYNGYLTNDSLHDDRDDESDDSEEWRFLWVTTPDGQFRIVVGQEWDYRQDIALDIVTSQLMPWLVALPLIVVLLVILISSELAPIKRLASSLRQRTPDRDDPIDPEDTPTEIRPLVDALNQLFSKTQKMMHRERRFTSDAAHELRSPLAALKVQTDVALLSGDDQLVREKALSQLHLGIDRATRLVDQLLTLSRLDSLDKLDDVETVALSMVLESAVMEIYHSALQAGVEIRLDIESESTLKQGQPLLLGLMVRNLLDNAIRYSPPDSTVFVTLEASSISVRDNGHGVTEEVLNQIGERFYRPPGQKQSGSGLGISIVKRIADLHGMTATFKNATQGGFTARLSW